MKQSTIDADIGDSFSNETHLIDRSTLTLLEHINLNVPNHKYILPFYVDLLGFGLDPRRAHNVVAGSKTVWTNCGASQFHLPYGEEAQVIPGSIGLRYNSLEELKRRLARQDDTGDGDKCFESYQIGCDGGREFVRVTDRYGNVFFCREGPEGDTSFRQPLVSETDTEVYGEVATKYGRECSECRGIDYVEFHCPWGTAEKIALFYDSVFDATTTVTIDKGDRIALVGFGNIDSNGKAAQYLLFREIDQSLPPYDGHHIALYVGTTSADFEQAFKNCEMAEIVWVNPRFSDKAMNLSGAKKWKQFRFKDIIDMKTGETILELEHEVRSIMHEAWPGRNLGSGES
jgi:hypothetical protein